MVVRTYSHMCARTHTHTPLCWGRGGVDWDTGKENRGPAPWEVVRRHLGTWGEEEAGRAFRWGCH